ncbi:hypothetical protein DQG13_29550 [Paenibacillus sp. YN15]|nr:hypothetical protein DQG13_29550 [Paenibacillus sp. YN15]
MRKTEYKQICLGGVFELRRQPILPHFRSMQGTFVQAYQRYGKQKQCIQKFEYLEGKWQVDLPIPMRRSADGHLSHSRAFYINYTITVTDTRRKAGWQELEAANARGPRAARRPGCSVKEVA